MHNEKAEEQLLILVVKKDLLQLRNKECAVILAGENL